MNQSLRQELQYLFPAWLATVVVPLLMVLFLQSPWARSSALMCFLLGCVITVAYSFRRDVERPNAPADANKVMEPRATWADRMQPLAIALFGAAALFSAICWLFRQGVEDPLVAPMLATMAVVPALCITPYLTLISQRPWAATVLTVFLVGCMKFAGAIVVVLIYGWDADKQGRLGMPWHQPDLLVWLFWIFNAVVSAAFYVLGMRTFQTQDNHQLLSSASG